MNLILTNFLSQLKNASLIQKKKLIVKFNPSFLPILKILYQKDIPNELFYFKLHCAV